MGDITIQKLKALTGQFDPEMIFKAPLAKTGISSLPECLKMCTNLTVLDVSFNSLTSVEALAPLKYLKTLILVSNQIEKLDSFKNLQAVEHIYLQNNKVKFISELNHLAGLNTLVVLSLQSLSGEDRNPVCEMDPAMYRDTVLRKLPQLRVLDEGRVSKEGNEFYGAVRNTFDPDAEMIFVEETTWARDLPWNEKPIHAKVKLDTTGFKVALDGCNKALAHADVEIQKARDRLAMIQTVLQEKLRQFKYHQPDQLSQPNNTDNIQPAPVDQKPRAPLIDEVPSDKEHRPPSRHKRPTDKPPSQIDRPPSRPTTPDRPLSRHNRKSIDTPPKPDDSPSQRAPSRLDNLRPNQPDIVPLESSPQPSRSPSRRKKSIDTPPKEVSTNRPSRPTTPTERPPSRHKKSSLPDDLPQNTGDTLSSQHTERPPSRHKKPILLDEFSPSTENSPSRQRKSEISGQHET
eukprot:Phypoly_transcript_06815.p1 GENE.Phypoly_transcript_06815~~Phypoly_transcript_06815.p1  ORF type:complete len:460 (+),score=56.93 Phypoly_transcript_06815:264-1643(+)